MKEFEDNSVGDVYWSRDTGIVGSTKLNESYLKQDIVNNLLRYTQFGSIEALLEDAQKVADWIKK